MKALMIGPDGQPTWQEASQLHPENFTHINRARKAFYVWKWARQADEKYKDVAQKDFEHFLMALDELFTEIKQMDLKEAERTEFNNFLQAIGAINATSIQSAQ